MRYLWRRTEFDLERRDVLCKRQLAYLRRWFRGPYEATSVIDVGYFTTPYGQKAAIFLEETGLAYYDLFKGEHLTSYFRRLKPDLKLPSTMDYEPSWLEEPLAVFESDAILLAAHLACY